MYKKFEINRTNIKGGCQSGRKVVTHNSKSNFPLVPDNTRDLLTKICAVRAIDEKSICNISDMFVGQPI